MLFLAPSETKRATVGIIYNQGEASVPQQVPSSTGWAADSPEISAWLLCGIIQLAGAPHQAYVTKQ